MTIVEAGALLAAGRFVRRPSFQRSYYLSALPTSPRRVFMNGLTSTCDWAPTAEDLQAADWEEHVGMVLPADQPNGRRRRERW